MNKLLLIILLTLSLMMSACSQNLSPNSYSSAQMGTASTVKKGVIIGKRQITVDNNSGVGGLAGAATGAAAGSMIGGNTATNIMGAIGGAVVGGLTGNAIDKSIHKQEGYEYIIKLNNGSTISVTQVQEMVFSINQRVLVIYGSTVRIVPDDTAGR